MRIILFGSGKVASMLYEEIKDEEFIVVDNDRRKWRKLWNGHGIEAPAIVEYVKRKPLSVFNYEFTNKYQNLQEKVYYDEQNHLFYVIYKHKRMYFSKKYDTEEKVKKYYSAILMEQDEKSPHRYLSDEFQVDQGSIVLDAGVAEGNFSLDIIDYVKKIYLVEADEDWIEALQYTFAPYMEKI